MSNGSSDGWKLPFIILVVAFVIAVGVLGYLVYGLNRNMEVIDGKGRALRNWAAVSATWSQHVNTDHLKTDHDSIMKVPPSHIPPPDDPPPRW